MELDCLSSLCFPLLCKLRTVGKDKRSVIIPVIIPEYNLEELGTVLVTYQQFEVFHILNNKR